MEVRGIIMRGKRHGTALGYPTANIAIPELSDAGIYAARAWIGDDEYIAAVFVDPTRNLLEAHLLDFSGDIYGKEMEVQLVKKIRQNKIFNDEAELKKAIATDVEEVRSLFGGSSEK